MATPSFIEKLAALGEAATPEPWATSWLHEGFGNEAMRTPAGVCAMGDEKRMIVLTMVEGKRMVADIDFMVATRNVWPEVIAVLDSALIVNREFGPTVMWNYPEGAALTETLLALRRKVEVL